MPAIVNPPPHIYSARGYDRAADRRRDEAWLEARRHDPETRLVLLQGLKPLVETTDAGPKAALIPLAELDLELDAEAPFLGLVEGRAVFARDIGGAQIGDAAYVELRSVGPALPYGEAGLLAYARALAHWHARHTYCGACGGLTQVIEAGHARRCPACGLDTFPRTDPAMILLVTAGERCVLARSPRFGPGMYSTIAGFVEPGESLEQTIARETREEIGIELERIHYRSSQPWPFPQSLMLGFRAETRFQPLAIDRDEIEDARWFTRAELANPETRPIKLPNTDSIARFLVEEWLYGGEI